MLFFGCIWRGICKNVHTWTKGEEKRIDGIEWCQKVGRNKAIYYFVLHKKKLKTRCEMTGLLEPKSHSTIGLDNPFNSKHSTVNKVLCNHVVIHCQCCREVRAIAIVARIPAWK